MSPTVVPFLIVGVATLFGFVIVGVCAATFEMEFHSFRLDIERRCKDLEKAVFGDSLDSMAALERDLRNRGRSGDFGVTLPPPVVDSDLGSDSPGGR